MENTLRMKIQEQNYKYISPSDKKDIPILYDLFVNKKIPSDTESCDVLNYLGIYYQHILHDKNTAIKYFELAFIRGSIIAVDNLGSVDYWDSYMVLNGKEIDYRILAAVNSDYMCLLGYVCYLKTKTDEAEKYYKIAINNGSVGAIKELFKLYIEKRRMNEAKELAFNLLSDAQNNKYTENMKIAAYQLLLSTYTDEMMKIENVDISDDFLAFLSIKKYRYLLPAIFRTLASICDEGIEAIDLEITYSPDGDGAKKAKADFVKRMNDLTKKNSH